MLSSLVNSLSHVLQMYPFHESFESLSLFYTISSLIIAKSIIPVGYGLPDSGYSNQLQFVCI
jgi:hypothetical protein